MSGKVELVTGATGAIGPALVNHLLTGGYEVRSYSLDAPAPGLFAGDVAHTGGDIMDADALASALRGVEVVFHLAALLHIENPPPELAPRYRQVNVAGARTVAEQAARAGVRRLIYFSTVKVYGVRQRTPVPEAQPPRPQTIYAQTKLEGERAVQGVDGLETVVLRLSAVYGPRLKGSWRRLADAASRGYFAPVGSLRNVHSLTSVDDVAHAALLAATHADAAGGTYNVVGHETPTLREILQAMYAALDRPMPRVTIPAWLALAGAFALEKGLALAGRRSPITVASIRQLTEDEAYSGAALRRLGFTAGCTLAEEWKRVFQEGARRQPPA